MSEAFEFENYKMIDVGGKAPTARRAIASGRISVGRTVFELIAENKLPKGNALALAEIAGVQAAKNASQTIPLCHPLTLDQVLVRCRLDSSTHSVVVECEARATAKTGVEMEALAGVSAALLTIYDLSKGTEPALLISDILLQRKEGGKSGIWTHPHPIVSSSAQEVIRPLFQGINFSVLTISDRVSSGYAQDGSGPAIIHFIENRKGRIISKAVVSDDEVKISHAILELSKNSEILICTGGTGIGPRDVTPEALKRVAIQSIPGFGELLRKAGASQTSASWISRSEAALVGKTLVVLLPGSVKAVTQGMKTLEEILPHALQMIRGEKHSEESYPEKSSGSAQ